MKKTVSVLLIAALLSSLLAAFSVPVSADMPTAEQMGGYENLCLTYTFDASRSDYGRFSSEDLMPYVAYLDEEGNAKDFFFDSYLFLPCVQNGPSGAPMHANESNPTVAEDWITYVNDTFTDGYNVDALEVAMGEAKSELGQPDEKAGVFFSILYPCTTSTSFGSLGGRNLNFSRQEDRKYAIKWIIDEQLRLYNEAGYENLELVGFYWLEEYLYQRPYNQSIETELFQYASEYLHSLGLKFIWIPWYYAYGYNQWSSLGFDVACMQPNLMWMDTPDYDRVEYTCSVASSNGMGVEMEIDPRVFTEEEYYYRYLVYLEDCMNGGAMDSIKMYYQDRNAAAVYKTACYSQTSRYRLIYDLTYKYAKGTLTQADIDDALSGSPIDIGDLDPVSIGKTYKASAPYYSDGSLGYQNNDGTELTDGVFGSSQLGTEWHGFHYTLAESDGRMHIVIDLGEVYDNLTLFYAEFCNYITAGIGNPSDVRLEISEDGSSYTNLGTLSLNDSSSVFSNVLYECAPVSARYVKLSFSYSDGNFVFCSEFLVCADPNASVSDTEQNVPMPSDGIYVNGINEKIEAGDCHIFTSEFGTITTFNANHTWTLNVVAEWSSERKAYVITGISVGSGSDTPAIELADSEILIAAHYWESSPESINNVELLDKATVGDAIVLYNLDLENGNFTSDSYIRIAKTGSAIFGDVTGDSILDMYDYLMIKSIYFGKYAPTAEEASRADVNGDGAIDMYDYLAVKSAYFLL